MKIKIPIWASMSALVLLAVILCYAYTHATSGRLGRTEVVSDVFDYEKLYRLQTGQWATEIKPLADQDREAQRISDDFRVHKVKIRGFLIPPDFVNVDISMDGHEFDPELTQHISLRDGVPHCDPGPP